MPLHAPNLAKKLQCLYQRHASVYTHELLAAHLGIAPNNISTWINGNEVRGRDLVPDRHVKRITDLFALPAQWLELESLEEFKGLLSRSPAGAWHTLLAQAATSDAIALIRIETRVTPITFTRGLVADDYDNGLEQFRLGDRVYISISLGNDWDSDSWRGKAYAVVFSVDRAKTVCLCPSALAPEPRFASPTLVVPQKAPDKTLKVAGPEGLQSVLVLITREPLTDAVYESIPRECGVEALDRMAAQVCGLCPSSWRLYRKDYEVL